MPPGLCQQLEGGQGHELKELPGHRVPESHMPGLSKQSLADQQTAEQDRAAAALGSPVAMVSSRLSLGQPGDTGWSFPKAFEVA